MNMLKYTHYLLIAMIFIGPARGDPIGYHSVSERFSHKDWVAYRTESGCRPTIEFLLDNRVVKLSILKGDIPRGKGFYAHLYGEYVVPFSLNIEIDSLRGKAFLSEELTTLANERYMYVVAELYEKLNSKAPRYKAKQKVSLAGSSAALRFCGFIK